jgi:hypothetical protein
MLSASCFLRSAALLDDTTTSVSSALHPNLFPYGVVVCMGSQRRFIRGEEDEPDTVSLCTG